MEAWFKTKGFAGPVGAPLKGDRVRYWYRRIKGTERHQFVVYQFNPGDIMSGAESYAVEVVFEGRDDTWGDFSFYGINEAKLKRRIGAYERRLYAAAVAAGANPQHYRLKGK